MAGARPPSRVEYDADTRLLAFVGTLTLLLGSLFWLFVGLRLARGMAPAPFGTTGPSTVVAFALVPVGLLASLASWGLRTKLQAGEPVPAWEVRRSLIAGLVVGVVVGFVVYVALAYKLRDPGFLTVAGEPGPGNSR
jgi:hypothetical protein